VSAAVVFQGSTPTAANVSVEVGNPGVGGQGGNAESVEPEHDGIHGIADQRLSLP
jgi:hypothetical protein